MSTFTFIFIAIWAVLTIGFPIYFRKRGAQEGQMLATGFGILGTFIGIVIGLLHFDTGNIDQSVPQLLDGLRFAFFTSITGMGFSLLIGAFPKALGFETEATGGDKSETQLLAEVLSEMKQLNSNIAGDNDTTLITQVQKLRTSINDKQDELKKSFDEFAREMAENNVKALIEAVQKVMDDFSTQINDHLGENFKRLSEGVENLVVWQDQYREQLSVATQALQESNKALGTSVESMSVMTERAQEFDNTAKELKESLEVMGQSMTGIKELAESLQDSGKQIRDEMNEIMRGATDEMQKTMNKTLADFGSNLASISGKMADDFERIQHMLENSTGS